MTREEKAIIYFKDMRKRMCEDYLNVCPKDSIAYHATLAEKDFYDTAIKALEQQPCEYAISREDAEALFHNARKALMEQSRKETIKDFNTRDLMLLNAEQMIHLLPSVTPQPKIGRWAILKDEYGDVVNAVCTCCDESGNHKWAFCPNCGAKMDEVKE